MQTKILKSGRKWQWQILKGKYVAAGGYCKTKSDAETDAAIALKNLTAPVPADTTTANGILLHAAAIIDARANQRDTIQERSMARCVAAFNGLTNHELTEEQGWIFMAILKMARAQNGRSFQSDDYVDGSAYIALAGECVQNTQT